jgi:hypothetical protein
MFHSESIVQWKTSDVEASLNGKVYTYQFHWRDPVEYFEDLITDPSLMPYSDFHSARKYLVNGTTHKRLVDEPFTANEWWDIEASNPHLCIYICSYISYRAFFSLSWG